MGPVNIILDRNWFLEGKCVLEFEKIIYLLSTNKDAWVIENGQILFYNENDLEEFNAYIFNIQDIVKEQQLIQQQCIDQAKESLRLMKDNLK